MFQFPGFWSSTLEFLCLADKAALLIKVDYNETKASAVVNTLVYTSIMQSLEHCDPSSVCEGIVTVCLSEVCCIFNVLV